MPVLICPEMESTIIDAVHEGTVKKKVEFHDLCPQSSDFYDSCLDRFANSKHGSHHIFPFQFLVRVKNISMTLGIDQFQDVDFLAMGNNSVIYSARQGTELVALKMLKKELADPISALKEIYGEMQLLTRMNHPNIINIKASGRTPRQFIVLQKLEGGTLAQLLHKSKGALPISKALDIAFQLASALKYLHNDMSQYASVIHRDLKPQNIGFTADNQLKLFDFGLAITVKKRLQYSSRAYEMTGNVGSRAYMAPEVALSQPYTEKVDIYSFGVILWQLLTGQTPFADLSEEEYIEKVAKGGLRPNLSNNFSSHHTKLEADFNSNMNGSGDAERDRERETEGSPGAQSSSPSVAVWPAVDDREEACAMECCSLVSTAMHLLMEQCWAEDSFLRPSCLSIMRVLQTEMLEASSINLIGVKGGSLRSSTVMKQARMVTKMLSNVFRRRQRPGG